MSDVTNIIIVFPGLEDAKKIKNLLTRSGITVTSVCTTGAQAINCTEDFSDGILICGYKFPDMMYTELLEYLPKDFEMLLVAPRGKWEECQNDNLICLEMPIKIHDLQNTVGMMCQSVERRRKKRKSMPRVRNQEEMELIKRAKNLLMMRNNMSEEAAHKYIQKCSMDSSTNLLETAQMILSLMQ